jgi:hypothetical protein
LKALAATLALVLALALGLAGTAEAKKKGGGKAATFAQTLPVNLAIPQGVASARSTPLLSTIVVGKKFKGKTVADVNVTGIQTTGSNAGAADDLIAYLVAPNGRTLQLFWHVGDQSLGPWTLDDDSSVFPCNVAMPPCVDPDATLNRPFAGTSNTAFDQGGGYPPNGSLSIFNGLPMKGAWTFLICDTSSSGAGDGTSTLNQWGLQITAERTAKSK